MWGKGEPGTEAEMGKPAEDVSPVVGLIEHLYENAFEGTGKSWARLNPALRTTLKAAVEAGFRFERDDFKTIYDRFNGSYWFHRSGQFGIGEQFYTLACRSNNRSACESFEHFAGRPAFTVNRKRVHEWAELELYVAVNKAGGCAWRRARVTSFAECGSKVSVVVIPHKGEKRKVLTVTLKGLRQLARRR